MSVETPSQKLMAAAWKTEAEAQLLSSVTTILAQLDKVPAGALRALLEARLTKLLEHEVAGAAAQAVSTASDPQPPARDGATAPACQRAAQAEETERAPPS